MNVSLYQAAAALDGNVRWQQMISENMAASSTPGFKKDEISFSSVQAGLLGSGSNELIAQKNPSILPKPNFSINFKQGELRNTGDSRNVAVHGPGFLSVRLPDGQTAYTRDGEFRVNAQGRLVNKENFELLGNGDAPIDIDVRNPGKIEISPKGEVSQGGIVRGRLQVSEFPDPTKLDRIGGGYYTAPNGIAPEEATNTQVSQGFLEASNVTPTIEMSNLMLALRHFEANQKIIQMQDERMGRVIQEFSATA